MFSHDYNNHVKHLLDIPEPHSQPEHELLHDAACSSRLMLIVYILFMGMVYYP